MTSLSGRMERYSLVARFSLKMKIACDRERIIRIEIRIFFGCSLFK